MEWVHEVGLAALREIFEANATAIAGPKGSTWPNGRGRSKNAASRHLVEWMGAKMRDYFSRPLFHLKLLVLMVDEIVVAGQTAVVALGITEDGTKEPLGLWQGSMENAALCISLLQDLIGRGLEMDGRILSVIDGGKGIRKALEDVLGNVVVVQRCQLH